MSRVCQYGRGGGICWLVVTVFQSMLFGGKLVLQQRCSQCMRPHLLQESLKAQLKFVHLTHAQSPSLIFPLNSAGVAESIPSSSAVPFLTASSQASLRALFFSCCLAAFIAFFSSIPMNMCSGFPLTSFKDLSFLHLWHLFLPLKLQLEHELHSHPPSGKSQAVLYFLQAFIYFSSSEYGTDGVPSPKSLLKSVTWKAYSAAQAFGELELFELCVESTSLSSKSPITSLEAFLSDLSSA